MKNLDETLKEQIERAKKLFDILVDANKASMDLINKIEIKKEQYEKIQNDKELS
jgi:hypothetical protein